MTDPVDPARLRNIARGDRVWHDDRTVIRAAADEIESLRSRLQAALERQDTAETQAVNARAELRAALAGGTSPSEGLGKTPAKLSGGTSPEPTEPDWEERIEYGHQTDQFGWIFEHRGIKYATHQRTVQWRVSEGPLQIDHWSDSDNRKPFAAGPVDVASEPLDRSWIEVRSVRHRPAPPNPPSILDAVKYGGSDPMTGQLADDLVNHRAYPSEPPNPPERDPHVMLAMTQAAMRVELGEANVRIAQLEADSRAYGEVASCAVRTARHLDKVIARVQALAAQWREDSQTFWADQLAQALDPNDLYPGLLAPVGEPLKPTEQEQR